MRIPHPELAHANSIKEAEALQETVRERISIKPLSGKPHRIAGCDVAYSKDGVMGFGAVLVLDLATLIKIEHRTAHRLSRFPYIPGLFAYRELPVLLEVFKDISEAPDVLLVEGHGIAHPRRAGLASHVGVTLDIPTIGCAKTALGGTWQQPGNDAGAWTDVKFENDTVGIAYRSRSGSQPLFLSPGHLIDLESITKLMPRLFKDRRLPEPIALAHDAAVKTRTKHGKLNWGQ